MDTLENKKIVQEALDERATKRKNVIVEEEQNAITTQMIDIVNKNAFDAEQKRKENEHKATEQKRKENEHKATEQKRKKKISLFKKQANYTMLSVYASLVQLGFGIISYIVGATELWSAIIACVLAAVMFSIQIAALLNNSRKLYELM